MSPVFLRSGNTTGRSPDSFSSGPRRIGVALVLTLLVFALALLTDETAEVLASVPQQQVTAFQGVHVVPMDEERILRDHTVVVQDGRITAVGPAAEVAIPEGAVVIEGRGLYLMPGLAEMHAHVPGPPERGERFPGPHDPVGVENTLFLFVANGVTTVRGMIGDPYHLELRDRIAAGELIGPSIYSAGSGLVARAVPDLETVERLVREQQEAGYDFLKIFDLEPEVYAHMADTAQRLGIPFAGHVPAGVGLEGALESGQLTIDHLDRYVEFLVAGDADCGESGFFGSGLLDCVDPDRMALAAELTREAGVWNVPTLTLVENVASPEAAELMAQRAEMRYLPRDMVESWVNYKDNLQAQEYFQPPAATRLVALRRQIVHALHKAGALLALGSDAPQHFNVPGFSAHTELESLVEAGLSPYQALVTGTRNPALLLGERDEWGTVEVGRRADLVLLEANPLEDVANLRQRTGVMVNGRWLSGDDIEKRLEAIAAHYR